MIRRRALRFAVAFGLLGADDLVEQFGQHLLAHLRLLLEKRSGDRESQLLGDAGHEGRLGRGQAIGLGRTAG